jgi:hypothetical protein
VNFRRFGLSAEPAAAGPAPQWHYSHEAETRDALDLILNVTAWGTLPSDRTIAHHVAEIWDAKPYPAR